VLDETGAGEGVLAGAGGTGECTPEELRGAGRLAGEEPGGINGNVPEEPLAAGRLLPEDAARCIAEEADAA